MALIITSNVNLDDKPDTSNVFKPYSYTNHLTSTMKLPPNSQIALQSAKINKNGTFQVSRENSQFNLYFGEEAAVTDADIDDFVSAPTMGFIGNITGDDVESLTPSDTAAEIQKGMEQASYHPFLYGQILVEVERAAVVPREFKGFKYTIGQSTAKTNSVPSAIFTDKRIIADRDKTYNDNGTGTLSNDAGAGHYFYGIYDKQSVSLANGDVIFDISGANLDQDNSAFRVGLTRWNRERPTGGVGLAAPIYYNNTIASLENFKAKEFYDYVVYRRGEMLWVAQTVKFGGNADIRLKNITYWGHAGANFASQINWRTDRLSYTKIKFNLNGERLNIFVWFTDHLNGGAAADWIELVGSNVGGDLENQAVPISQPKWTMYPVMASSVGGVSIQLESLHTANNIPVNNIKNNPLFDWWVKLQDTALERWAFDIEQRPFNNVGDGGVLKTTYQELDAGGTYIEGYKNGIISSPSMVYGFNYTAGSMAERVLGFVGRSVAFIDGVPAQQQVIISSSTPITSSDVSLFIRLNNFDQQCVNAKQGSNYSKIIAHLPRFDNSGNDVGGLYFEPQERVYIDLNNTNETFINSFDLDIVYDNEQLCKSIAGKTIIVLHIKQKK
jgi:hypothetical protein